MKKIVVVSDNHYAKECIEFLKKEYKDVDYFFHCGDSDLNKSDLEGWHVVYGNHDEFMSPFSKEIIVEVEGHKFLIVHGHKIYLFYGYYDELIKHAKEKGCDVVCFGHIHWYVDYSKDGVRALNPGSIRYPRDGEERTYMLLEVDEKEIRAERKVFKGGIY